MPGNLWLLIEPSLIKHSGFPAWICRERVGKRTISYQQIHAAVLHTASLLRERNVGPGDTIGITAPNGPEWTVAALATWKIGACIAPIHIGNSDHEIEQQIKAVQPKVMLIHDFKLECDNTMPISLASEQQRIDAEARQPIAEIAHAVALRIYTSGSTGTPKIVQLSHSNMVSNTLAATKIEHFDSNDRFISLLPFSHAMGLTGTMLLPLLQGCTIVAPRALAATEILETLAQEKISVVIAVPRLFRNVMLGLELKFKSGGISLAIYRSLLRKLPVNLRQHLNAPIRKKFGGKIKTWVSGGSHLDGKITRYYHELGLPLRQGYGLTETAPLVSIQENFDSALNSVGKPVSQVEVSIHQRDEKGCGELWVRGPNVMLGYEDEAQTAAVMKDGWFNTGDVARLDEQGRITLTGRSKRLIVTEAGKNVHSEELEILLERDPAVKEAGVLEADKKPVCVMAIVGDDIEAEARRALKVFNAMVSPHNQITRFSLVEELPRTPLGKMAVQQLPVLFAEHEVK